MIFVGSDGKPAQVALGPMSVKDLFLQILQALKDLGITIQLNLMPQEVSHPIPFDQDTTPRNYDGKVINAWWRIMLSTYRVLLQFHSRFYGITPKPGLFFGTLDLRDVRYKGLHLPPNKDMGSYIARNAMDDAQFEVGWSASNEKYPTPSFFAFAFPKPDGLEKAKVSPAPAKWVPSINEFILDYEGLRKTANPDQTLLEFFESTYLALAQLGKWDAALVVNGKPI